MKRIKCLVVTSLCLSVLSGSAFAAEREDLLKEAQLQETTVRDLDAAIRLYLEYLARPGNDRPAQAEATLHLGMCLAKQGKGDEAKAAWQKVIEEFPDQAEPYAQAKSQLQMRQAAERAEVPVSTGVVKIVHDPLPTLWNLDFIRVQALHTIDTKGQIVADNHLGTSFNFDYYLKRGRFGVGLSGGYLSYSFGSYSSDQSIAYINPHVHLEKRVMGAFFPYLNVGPAAYQFKFSGAPVIPTEVQFGGTTYTEYFSGPAQQATRWTGGVAGEVGTSIGWTRGVTLNLGYAFHSFFQVTPPDSYINSFPADQRGGPVFQNHGLRLIGGPFFGLSFRW